MRKNKIQKFLVRQAEINRQFMVLGAVLFVTGLMSVGIMQMTEAATTGTTNVNLTVSAGSLAIDQVPSQFDFSSDAPGATVNGNSGATDGNAVKTNDTRGTKAGYTVSGYFAQNFQNAGAQQSAIASQMTWYANQISIVNVTGTTGDMLPGTLATFTGVGSAEAKTLATNNAINNGAGAFNIHNLKMNYAIPLTTPAQAYTTKLVITIV